MIKIGTAHDGKPIFSKAPLVNGANYVIEPDRHGIWVATRTNRKDRRRRASLAKGRSEMTLRIS